jgi:hypothetical protein
MMEVLPRALVFLSSGTPRKELSAGKNSSGEDDYDVSAAAKRCRRFSATLELSTEKPSIVADLDEESTLSAARLAFQIEQPVQWGIAK